MKRRSRHDLRLRAWACLLPVVLVACSSGEDAYYSASRLGSRAEQPLPVNYRAELIAMMRAYLNDPAGVREAGIGDPVLKEVGGQRRYVVCVRYDARDFNGRYPGAQNRPALFLDGRLDRLLERSAELCNGQAFAPFPEIERLTR